MIRTTVNYEAAEVIDRWHKLFKGTLKSQRFVAGEEQSKSALKLLSKQAA